MDSGRKINRNVTPNNCKGLILLDTQVFSFIQGDWKLVAEPLRGGSLGLFRQISL